MRFESIIAPRYRRLILTLLGLLLAILLLHVMDKHRLTGPASGPAAGQGR